MKFNLFFLTILFSLASVIGLCAEPKPKEGIKPPPTQVKFTVDGETKTYFLNPSFMAEFVEGGSSSLVTKTNSAMNAKSGWLIHKTTEIDLVNVSKKLKNPNHLTNVYSTSPDSSLMRVVFPGIIVVRFREKPTDKTLDQIQLQNGIFLHKKLHDKLYTFTSKPGPYFEAILTSIQNESNVVEVYPDISTERSLK